MKRLLILALIALTGCSTQTAATANEGWCMPADVRPQNAALAAGLGTLTGGPVGAVASMVTTVATDTVQRRNIGRACDHMQAGNDVVLRAQVSAACAQKNAGNPNLANALRNSGDAAVRNAVDANCP